MDQQDPVDVSLGGVKMSEHTFLVPLDWDLPQGEQIRVFVRQLRRPEENLADPAEKYVIYLQGGPGFQSPRPFGLGGWMKQALANGYRALLLDQRGTGRSHPITSQSLGHLTPEQQAAILVNFRADSIVKDCEFIRKNLNAQEIPKWTLLGQSFGGFVSSTYLSYAPSGLEAVLITGGLPPLGASADEVYRACFTKLAARNEAYFQRYPHDAKTLTKVVTYLQNHTVKLTNGTLTPRRLQSSGFSLGMSDGFVTIHYLLEDPFIKIGNAEETLSFEFLSAMAAKGEYFATNPFYAILHESIYCTNGFTSNWAADRVLQAEHQEYNTEVLFTGEMVFPSFFDDWTELAPLKQAAQILAEKKDWKDLYDFDQLSKNTVPVAAVVYVDDMYVGKDLSLKTAQMIKGTKVWLTPNYQHNGLRVDGEKIFLKLLEILKGEELIVHDSPPV